MSIVFYAVFKFIRYTASESFVLMSPISDILIAGGFMRVLFVTLILDDRLKENILKP